MQNDHSCHTVIVKKREDCSKCKGAVYWESFPLCPPLCTQGGRKFCNFVPKEEKDMFSKLKRYCLKSCKCAECIADFIEDAKGAFVYLSDVRAAAKQMQKEMEEMNKIRPCTPQTAVYCCPVCEGRGILPGGFYYDLSGTGTSYCTPDLCRACKGKGIIWR